MRKILLIIANFLIVLSIFSFEIKENKIYDIYGNSIEIKKYNRIVIIDPAVVETFYMLHTEDKIVGIANNPRNEIYPKDKTEKLPFVGTAFKPSFEKVISLQPDLVILHKSASGMTDGLKNLNIPFIFHDSSKTINDILNSIKIYGILLGIKDEAEKLYNNNMAILRKIKNDVNNNHLSLKGTIIYSASPMISFTNNSLQGEILTYLGIKNIAKKSAGTMPIISAEEIIASDIDIILASKNIGSIENLLKSNPILKKTKVAKNNNIILYDTAMLRPSARLFINMEKIYELLLKIQYSNS